MVCSRSPPASAESVILLIRTKGPFNPAGASTSTAWWVRLHHHGGAAARREQGEYRSAGVVISKHTQPITLQLS